MVVPQVRFQARSRNTYQTFGKPRKHPLSPGVSFRTKTPALRAHALLLGQGECQPLDTFPSYNRPTQGPPVGHPFSLPLCLLGLCTLMPHLSLWCLFGYVSRKEIEARQRSIESIISSSSRATVVTAQKPTITWYRTGFMGSRGLSSVRPVSTRGPSLSSCCALVVPSLRQLSPFPILPRHLAA